MADWKRMYTDVSRMLDKYQNDVVPNLRKQLENRVEVVHGRWEKAEYKGFVRCDQCKDVYINEEWLMDGKWNNCPNCGADMRERSEGE